MSDDIKIKIGQTGATEAAAGVDKLVASTERLKKTQEMIARTQEQIKRQNLVDQLKAEAAEVNRTTQSWADRMKVLSGSASGATNEIEKLGTNTQKLRAQLGPAAALVGNLGGAITQLAPAASGMVATLQRTGMAFGQMLGVLGGGTGLVVGGLVAAVGGLATYFSEASKEAEEMEKATKANTEALGDYTDQVNTLRETIAKANAKGSAESDLQKLMREGRASPEQYASSLGALDELIRKRQAEYQDQLNRIQEDPRNRVSKMLGAGDDAQKSRVARESNAATRQMQRDVNDLRSQIDEIKKGQGYASEQAYFAEQQKQDQKSAGLEFDVAGTPEGAKAKEKPSVALDTAGAQYYMSQFEDTTADQVLYYQKTWEEAEKQKLATAAQMKEQSRQTELESEDQYMRLVTDQQGGWLNEQLRLQEEFASRKAQIRAQEKAAELQVAQVVTGAALKGISEVIKGKKLEAGAILEGLGDQFVAAGTGLIFTGLGISANPLTPGLGSGMVSIGTAEVAFGLGLGAAGARMPGGSNSASGGGSLGGSKNGFDPSARSDPYGNTFTPPNSGPTIIQINMPTVLSPNPEDAIRMKQAADMAFNVYGSDAVPNYARSGR